MSALALSFNNTQFDVIDRNQQPWLRLHQIGAALGYSRPDAVNKIFQSNADEFTDSMTALVELDTNGGKQQVRIFSLRGCHLLAMFARTAVAKEFRKWVLDVLEKHTRPRNGLVELPEPPTKLAYSGCLTLEQQDVIKALVKERAEALPKEKQAGATIRCWSAIKKKFGCTYKEVPAENFVNIISLISRLPLEGELLPPPAQPIDNLFTIAMKKGDGLTNITLKFDAGENLYERYFVTVDDGVLRIQPIELNRFAMTEQQFIRYLTQERGYIVVKKTEVAAKLMA